MLYLIITESLFGIITEVKHRMLPAGIPALLWTLYVRLNQRMKTQLKTYVCVSHVIIFRLALGDCPQLTNRS